MNEAQLQSLYQSEFSGREEIVPESFFSSCWQDSAGECQEEKGQEPECGSGFGVRGNIKGALVVLNFNVTALGLF